MNKFRLYKPGWWMLHLLAVLFFLWLGHAVSV